MPKWWLDTLPGKARLWMVSQRPYFRSSFFQLVRHHAALGAEEGLVGGAGDDLGALLKGLLEVIAHQAQNVSHIVHYGGGYVLLVHELAYSRHGLLMQHHGLAEDYQLRPVAGR